MTSIILGRRSGLCSGPSLCSILHTDFSTTVLYSPANGHQCPLQFALPRLQMSSSPPSSPTPSPYPVLQHHTLELSQAHIAILTAPDRGFPRSPGARHLGRPGRAPGTSGKKRHRRVDATFGISLTLSFSKREWMATCTEVRAFLMPSAC